MENYTIDIAQLGQKAEGMRPVGFEKNLQPKLPSAKTDTKATAASDEEGSGEDEDVMGDYTLDLGALGDKPSSVVVEDRERIREEVASEDEGPEDFTQNMEAWMRGTQKWKKEKDEDIAEDREPDPDPEQNLGSIEREEAPVEESAFEPLGTSTPAPPKDPTFVGIGAQGGTKLQAPPFSRMNTAAMHDKATEEVLDQISALQAEVERMRLEEEHRRIAYQSLEQQYETSKREYLSAREEDQAECRALRRQNKELLHQHQTTQDDLRQDNLRIGEQYEQTVNQLAELQDKQPGREIAGDPSLELDHEGLRQELATTQKQKEDEQKVSRVNCERLKHELESARNESIQRRDLIESIQQSSSIKIRDLTSKLEARNKEVALERKESIDRANEAAALHELLAQKDKDMHNLSSEIKAIKMELDHAHEQLSETRRIVETVEDENDRLVQQNERQAQDITELLKTVKAQSIETPATKPYADTAVDVTSHKATLETQFQLHQSTIISLNADHARELQTLRSTLLKAGEANSAKAHTEVLQTLKQQILSLEQQLHDKVSATHPVDHAANEREPRSAIHVLNSKLENSNAQLKNTREELSSARQKTEEFQRENAIVNVELERRFAETIEAREREWRKRVALLFRERERMGKALMLGWGREEVGKVNVEGGKGGERGQGYRYRYVKRDRDL